MNPIDRPEQQPPVEIPKDAISPAALQNLIEAFILREGTDYGAIEIEHEKKVLKITKLLETGRVKIVFDPNSESVTLMTQQDWQKKSTQHKI